MSAEPTEPAMSAEQKPPAMLEKVPRELLAVLITGSVDKANATAEKARSDILDAGKEEEARRRARGLTEFYDQAYKKFLKNCGYLAMAAKLVCWPMDKVELGELQLLLCDLKPQLTGDEDADVIYAAKALGFLLGLGVGSGTRALFQLKAYKTLVFRLGHSWLHAAAGLYLLAAPTGCALLAAWSLISWIGWQTFGAELWQPMSLLADHFRKAVAAVALVVFFLVAAAIALGITAEGPKREDGAPTLLRSLLLHIERVSGLYLSLFGMRLAPLFLKLLSVQSFGKIPMQIYRGNGVDAVWSAVFFLVSRYLAPHVEGYVQLMRLRIPLLEARVYHSLMQAGLLTDPRVSLKKTD